MSPHVVPRGAALGSLQSNKSSLPFGTDGLAARRSFSLWMPQVSISPQPGIDPAVPALAAHFPKGEEKKKTKLPPELNAGRTENTELL